MKALRAFPSVLLFWFGVAVPPAAAQAVAIPVEVDAPAAVLGGIPFAVTIEVPDGLDGTPYGLQTADGRELVTGTLVSGANRVSGLTITGRAELPLTVTGPGLSSEVAPLLLPPLISIVPPLLAILFALVFRQVVVSLFAGIWLGAFFLTGLRPVEASLSALDEFILGSLANDADRISIALFSLLLGGMVGVITHSGGTRGIVEALRPWATSSRRGQFMAWFAGIAIFFDDYANTLIVGNTMRPVTDRLRVSRERLSYIVDSTAAPVAILAPISTWVGFEISLIGDALTSSAAQASDPAARAALSQGASSAFTVFLHSIPYRFYPILTIYFVLLTIVTRRDFGPMYTAQRRATSGGGVTRPGSAPLMDPAVREDDGVASGRDRWYNAAIPVLAVVLVSILGIYFTGRQSLGAGDHTLRDIIGAGNAFSGLLWASFTGCVVAILLAVSQRLLSLARAMDAWVDGMRSMLLAIVILVLAWGLGGVTEALGTGSYLAQLLGDSLPVRFLPVLVFLVAAATSFATGTSWGTMAILFPVVVPLSVAMGAGLPGTGNYEILLGAVSSVMAGAIFGDHCSPISDTTVMSSMACAVDHIDHVRTQLPYAILVAVVGMLAGDIPTAYGLSPFVAIIAGAAILYLVLRISGGRVDDGSAPAADAIRFEEIVLPGEMNAPSGAGEPPNQGMPEPGLPG